MTDRNDDPRLDPDMFDAEGWLLAHPVPAAKHVATTEHVTNTKTRHDAEREHDRLVGLAGATLLSVAFFVAVIIAGLHAAQKLDWASAIWGAAALAWAGSFTLVARSRVATARARMLTAAALAFSCVMFAAVVGVACFR